MAYAAALMAGLAGLWLCLSADASGAIRWAAAAASILFALLMAWRMRIVDREAAPYFRAPALLILALRRVWPTVKANLDLARAAMGADTGLHPALVRLKTRRSDDAARATFANALSSTPGLLCVDCDGDSLLAHALVEDDADVVELQALEEDVRRAWRGAGA
jgi:multicomponent Na+:H+ antiporter subunit E